MSRMPAIGDLLPRLEEAHGIEVKLIGYSLNLDSVEGGPKAELFRRALGIDAAEVDHLASELRAGIRAVPVSAVRDNRPFGLLCEVRVPVRGLGRHRDRVVTVTTAWELRYVGDRPRLVTAYVKG